MRIHSPVTLYSEGWPVETLGVEIDPQELVESIMVKLLLGSLVHVRSMWRRVS